MDRPTVAREHEPINPGHGLHRDLQLSNLSQHVAFALAKACSLIRLEQADGDWPNPSNSQCEAAEALVMEQDDAQREWALLHARAWVKRQMLASAVLIQHRIAQQQGVVAGHVADAACAALIDELCHAETPNFTTEFLAAYRHGLVTPRGGAR
jgi:hypothetical protein